MHTIARDSTNVNSLPIVSETGEILEDRADSGKKTDWSGKKKMALKFADVLAAARELDETIISEKRLGDVRDCASFLLFARDKTQRLKLRGANFCRHRLCPMCNWRRSLLLFAQTSQVVEAIKEREPAVRFLFVTLTVKNCPATGAELVELLQRMNDGFAALTNKSRKYKAAAAFKENLLGYMKAVEITYNSKTKTFHPHIHAVFAVRPSYFTGRCYISKKGWQSLWTELLGVDYEAIVMPKAIDEKRQKGAVAEVAKYPVKPTDIITIKDKDEAAAITVELMHAINGRRLVTFGGLFKEIRAELKLKDIEAADADLVRTDSEKDFTPVERVMFRWRARFGVYVC